MRGRSLLTLILLAAVVWSVTSVPWGGDLAHSGGGASIAQFLAALFSLDLSPSFLRVAIEASWKTVAYAVTGMTLALVIGLPLGVLASGVVGGSSGSRTIIAVWVRVVLAFLRAIHELVWAWLFVVAIGLSPMAAILALALPYGGILGRNFSELLTDVPEAPLRALRMSGASELKVFLYGRLPMALPDMLSYGFYRFECAIRAAAIFSFVGVAGLGFQIQLSLDELLYDQVWTLLLLLIAMVALVDLWSATLRRQITS